MDTMNEYAKSSTIIADDKSMVKLLSLISKMGIDTISYVANDNLC